jgi:hypothetical protein
MRYAVIAATIITGLVCAGCSSRPSDTDIAAAFASKLAQPGCIASTSFTSFPVPPDTATRNAATFDAFVQAGLLAKTGSSYDLTEAGRAAFKSEQRGFCYASGYEIASVKDTSTLGADQVGPAVEEAWRVTLDIRPKDVQDWVKSPALSAVAHGRQNASLASSATYQVTVGKIRGDAALKIVDPAFSFQPGAYLNQGW